MHIISLRRIILLLILGPAMRGARFRNCALTIPKMPFVSANNDGVVDSVPLYNAQK